MSFFTKYSHFKVILFYLTWLMIRNTINFCFDHINWSKSNTYLAFYSVLDESYSIIWQFNQTNLVIHFVVQFNIVDSRFDSFKDWVLSNKNTQLDLWNNLFVYDKNLTKYNYENKLLIFIRSFFFIKLQWKYFLLSQEFWI